MNKKELIMTIATETKLSQKDVEKAVNCFCQTIASALEQGEKVQLVDFGCFDVRKRKARIGKNPRTAERLEIPPATVPVFKAGKALREKVNILK